MKKIKWLFGLCLMMLVVCGSGDEVYALSSSHVTDDGIKYETYTDSDEVTITGYNGTNETVIIPSEIDEKPVTCVIGKFFDTRIIKHCTIPEGVYKITSYKTWLSKEVTTLESVSLPSTLKIIGDGVFYNCVNLKEIVLPEDLITIGEGTFYNCSSLKKVVIPESVTSIGDGAFNHCDNLNNITISDNLTSIGYNAFYRDNLNLTIYANSNSYARTYANQYRIKFSCLNTHDWDNGVITTETTAINDGIKTFTCTACKTKRTEKIAKLGLPQKGKSITETNSNNTYKVTKSAAKNGTVELAKVSKSTSSITIPDTVAVDGVTYKVTSVSKNAFKNNKKVKKVTIGKNITKINANTFYGCKNLKTITIKSTNLKSVGKNAFKGINSKAKIKVPKNKLSKYKKFLKGKGQENTVKITK